MRAMNRTLRVLAALSCASLAGSCGGAETTARPAAPTAVSAESVVQTGAATITAQEMQAHVTLLASDEYGGRETLRPGYELAAEYLSSQFAAYGLSPMPGQS